MNYELVIRNSGNLTPWYENIKVRQLKQILESGDVHIWDSFKVFKKSLVI
jgi:hypothetical protein